MLIYMSPSKVNHNPDITTYMNMQQHLHRMLGFSLWGLATQLQGLFFFFSISGLQAQIAGVQTEIINILQQVQL